jgi:hypothetical protein
MIKQREKSSPHSGTRALAAPGLVQSKDYRRNGSTLPLRPGAIEWLQPASDTAAEFILLDGDGLYVSAGRAQVLVI